MKKSEFVYEIQIKGHLDPQWSDWLGNMMLRHTDSGETILRGALRDQTALYGVLNKLHDLGLTLVSVKRSEQDGENKMKKEGGVENG